MAEKEHSSASDAANQLKHALEVYWKNESSSYPVRLTILFWPICAFLFLQKATLSCFLFPVIVRM
jgi:hypothetical protein